MAKNDFSSARVVGSIEEIYGILDDKTCPDCEAHELGVESKYTVKGSQKIYDVLMVKCYGNCGWKEEQIFDVTGPYKAQESIINLL